MLEIIAGTRESIMNRAIVEAVDTLTKYTDENRYGLPGWKTNAGHLLNQKFIVDWMIEYRDCNTLNPYGIRYNSNYMHIVDLIKALCHITGTNFSGTTDLRDYFHGARRMQTNTWYDLDFFRV